MTGVRGCDKGRVEPGGGGGGLRTVPILARCQQCIVLW